MLTWDPPNASYRLENISFAGSVDPDAVAGYMRRAKVLVFPSLRSEGLPNVIMEAMAHGVPVIATRRAGIPDLVRAGDTGVLVEPGNASDIARAVQLLAGDDGLRRRMGRNCFEEMKKYSWPAVVTTVERELSGLAIDPSSPQQA